MGRGPIADGGIIRFGRFRLDLARRDLHADGAPVPIGNRALDVLIVLVESGGGVVTKDELLRRIWPGAVVEENILQVNISALRKALGEDRDFIRTLSGRGYSFAAETAAADASDAPTGPAPPSNLPAPVSGLVGRDAPLSQLAELLPAHRLVTLVGAAGIGKTRLAIELGQRLLPRFADGVWLAELAPLSDPALVLPTVAGVLGLAGGPATADGLARALAGRRMLLLLDNCEHLIDAAAALAEAFLHASASLSVLATSREAMRVAGERIFRVPPLELPADAAGDFEATLRHGAARLFVERARAADARLRPDAATAAAIVAICRRLDGIPLAIELAAARAAALGVDGVAARLDDRFRLLTDGRRTALPRHQTLRAALDWSHGLLPAPQRAAMRRLAIFAGEFSLPAARAVAAAPDGADDVTDLVHELAAKSLLAADVRGVEPRYRMLETTRAYALGLLADSGEAAATARRHAGYFCGLLERAEAGDAAAADGAIDNVRAALNWAFAPGGDPALGTRIAAAAVPLWVRGSLMAECRSYAERALVELGRQADRDPRTAMKLHAALGAALNYTTRPVAETLAAWSATARLARELGDTEYELRALRGQWAFRMNASEYRAALDLAEQFCALAARHGDPLLARGGDRLAALILHYLGEQAAARRRIEAVGEPPVPTAEAAPAAPFLLDHQVAADALLARILWLQGFPDQAARTAGRAFERARAAGHALSICHALAQAACPVALWTGDLTAADRLVAMLLEHASRNALEGWIARGQCFAGWLLIQRGEHTAGSARLRDALHDLRAAGSMAEYPAFLAILALALARDGRHAEARDTIGEAIARSDATGELWCVAELRRVAGELSLIDNPSEAAAEAHFVAAVELARRQDVAAFELRAATSLARLLDGQGRGREAWQLLSAARGRITEGSGSADIVAADALLAPAG